MRITRIQGENLASYRSFDLPLDHGALGEVPVYAIVGRTGAGKSTLLDAVLLALYGELPRVAGRKSIDLGLGYDAGKAVAIVRRGQTSARAACEFIGTDGVRYRSEWSVRKQRNGSLVEADPTLVEVGVGPVADVRNKTSHREAIERLVGINALEFRRAALLAQNDFATFLRAEPTERAQQLERITHTPEYTAIGTKIHALKVEREAAWSSAKAALGSCRALTAEAEAPLVEAAAAAAAAREAATRRVETLGAHTRFLDRRRELEATAAGARAAEAGAREAADARANDRERLAQARLGEPARGPWEAWRRAGEAVRERDTVASGAREAADAAAAAVEERARVSGERTAAAALLRAALDPADVARARAADAVVAEAGTRLEGHAAAAADLAGRAGEARGAAEAARVEAERLRIAQAALGARLAALAPVVAVQADELALPALDALELARSASRAAVRAETEANAAARAAEERLRDTDAALARARSAADEAKAALDRLGAAPDVAASHRAAASARARASRAAVFRRAQEQCAAAERARSAPRQRQLDLERTLAEHAEAAPARATALAEARAELDVAQAAVEALKAVQSLDAWRAELRAGQACPLCGASEHPWAEHGAPRLEKSVEATARALDERVRALSVERDAAERDIVRMRAGAEQLALEVKAAEAGVAEAAAALEAAAAARAADGELPASEESDRDVRRAEEAAAEAEAAAERVARAAEAYTAALGAVGSTEQARAPLSEVAAAAAALREARSRAAADAEARVQAALAVAVPRFAGWPGGLPLEGQVVAEPVRRALRELAALQQEEHEVQKSLAIASARAAAAEAAAAGAELRAAESGRAAELAEAKLAAARAERAALFGGRPTDTVVSEHEGRLRAADQAASQAGKEHAAAEAAADAAARASLEAGAALERAEEARVQAEHRLEETLAGLGWTVGELESRLLPALDRDDLAAALEAVDRRVATAAAVRSEAERRVAALVAPEGFDEAALEGEVAAAAAALRDTSSAALAADTELRQAREEHARWQAQGARVDELDAAAQPWRRLAELIGGHDGKKFRELAQARTMQALAELANDQLKRFAVRYELRHLPEHPLELLVVDHDAGGEMRATSSLSGGETFLVSLALALALGRLSSRSLHLRTLFVDEGFGSLDSDSVDPVVDALRTLAEGGVQVGLISHVRGIADRLPARVEVLRRGATSELRVVRD
jgi:exonuclease SbcC